MTDKITKNVSIVDTSKNEAIGEPLRIWSNWLGGDPSTRDEGNASIEFWRWKT